MAELLAELPAQHDHCKQALPHDCKHAANCSDHHANLSYNVGGLPLTCMPFAAIDVLDCCHNLISELLCRAFD